MLEFNVVAAVITKPSPEKATMMRRGQRRTTLETVSSYRVCFIACEQILIERKPIDCNWLSRSLRLDSERSYHQGLLQKKHIKGDMEKADTSKAAADSLHDFSVLTSGTLRRWCAMILTWKHSVCAR